MHGLRYYCPWLGRWTTADPIGLQGGVNQYAYCRGDPVGKVDPGGTFDFGVGSMVQAGVDRLQRQDGSASSGSARGPPSSGQSAPKVTREEMQAGLEAVADDPTRLTTQGPVDESGVVKPPPAAPEGPRPFTPEERHLQAQTIGAGETMTTGATGAVLGQILVNLFHGVEPDSGDVAALSRTVGLSTGKIQKSIPEEQMQRASGKGPSREYSLPKGREYVPDVGSRATGRTAQVRTAIMEDVASKELGGVRLTHKPEYNPFLKPLGVSQRGEGSQLGPAAFSSRRQVAETMVHEELHHRWWSRGTPSPHHEGALDQKFEATVQRFMQMKGITR